MLSKTVPPSAMERPVPMSAEPKNPPTPGIRKDNAPRPTSAQPAIFIPAPTSPVLPYGTNLTASVSPSFAVKEKSFTISPLRHTRACDSGNPVFKSFIISAIAFGPVVIFTRVRLNG